MKKIPKILIFPVVIALVMFIIFNDQIILCFYGKSISRFIQNIDNFTFEYEELNGTKRKIIKDSDLEQKIKVFLTNIDYYNSSVHKRKSPYDITIVLNIYDKDNLVSSLSIFQNLNSSDVFIYGKLFNSSTGLYYWDEKNRVRELWTMIKDL